MITANLTPSLFKSTLSFFSGHVSTEKSKESGSPINRLKTWRAQNRVTFEHRRILGMKNSPLVRANLQRIHRECKEQWKASALKNPKLQATDQHIAAKMWKIISPTGQMFEFRNLKKFVRDNEQLFDAEDVVWKEQSGSHQTWCKAFQALSRLRPSCSKPLSEWNGWRWAGDASVAHAIAA
jgi:hypothetical protein